MNGIADKKDQNGCRNARKEKPKVFFVKSKTPQYTKKEVLESIVAALANDTNQK